MGLAKGARWTLYPYSSYWRGRTELDVEAAIRLHGSILGQSCWDLGAHYGIYTIGMALAVGEEGQVACFEPDPVSFSRCELHVKMNSISQVKLFAAAASDREGIANLILSQGAGESTSHFAYEDEQFQRNVTTVGVRTVVLDQLVESGQIRPADFIKVDVEGHGVRALKGARETIARNLPNIVMSFHSQCELDGTKQLLEPLGYCAYTCDGESLGWEASIFRTAVLSV